MNQEEKDYIDKKFSELENKYMNPDPKELWERSKKYRPMYYAYYKKVIPIALILTIGTMLITFWIVGLI